MLCTNLAILLICLAVGDVAPVTHTKAPFTPAEDEFLHAQTARIVGFSDCEFWRKMEKDFKVNRKAKKTGFLTERTAYDLSFRLNEDRPMPIKTLNQLQTGADLITAANGPHKKGQLVRSKAKFTPQEDEFLISQILEPWFHLDRCESWRALEKEFKKKLEAKEIGFITVKSAYDLCHRADKALKIPVEIMDELYTKADLIAAQGTHKTLQELLQNEMSL